ncbi:MAG: hypothetical protein EXR11_01115 [Rhodospirillaceae bacterium]|nr:hypothetical protein [Rhodospirillaceae bacterium]
MTACDLTLLSPRRLAITLLFNQIEPPDFSGTLTYAVLGPCDQNRLAKLRAACPQAQVTHFVTVNDTDIGDDRARIDVLVIDELWSRLDTDARTAMSRAIKTKLAPEGVVILDYDTTPGASVAAAVKRLALANNAADRISGIDFAARVRDSRSNFFAVNPQAQSALAAMQGASPAPAAGHALSFRCVASELGAIDLAYAGPVRLADAIARFNFSKTAAKMLADEPDLIARETIKDFFLNRARRWDIFARNPRRIDQQKAAQRIAAMPFITIADSSALETAALQTAFADIKLNEAAKCVFAGLAQGSASAMELAQRSLPGCENVWASVDSILVLLAMNVIAPVP